jgi:hypothetical protein
MNRALLLKELSHHGPAVLWLAASTLAAISVLLSVANLMEGGSAYDGLRTFLRYFAPVLTAVLCHRLVVLEYQGQTQLFLEGLPLSRTRMLVVKYLFGLGVALGLVLLATGLTLLVRAGVEPVDVRLLVNVGAVVPVFSNGVARTLPSDVFLADAPVCDATRQGEGGAFGRVRSVRAGGLAIRLRA